MKLVYRVESYLKNLFYHKKLQENFCVIRSQKSKNRDLQIERKINPFIFHLL